MGVKVREHRGAWWLFVDHKGQRKARRVGVGQVGKKAAEVAAVKIAAKLVEGGDMTDLETILEPKQAPEPERPALPTFADYAERWLTETIRPHRKQRTEEY